MRPIKFRAWNKKYKEMFSWKRLLELNENNTKEGPNKTIHHEHISLFQMILTNNDIGDAYELMQSTGLFDKNGDEIFRGDIVIFEYYGPTYIGEVSSNEFFHSCIKVGEKEFHIDNAMIGEIVGNIYDNPEMINQ